jgi:hypothetical protein
MSSGPDVTQLLQDWKNGDEHAIRRLTPIVYNELRRLAARYLRDEHAADTLRPTALVHEAYIRLVAQNMPAQLLVNFDRFADQDDVYVAYDNFSGAPDMRVAASPGTSPNNPPDFSSIDSLTGFSTGFGNPGHRLATDSLSGAIYSLFQRVDHFNADGSKNINFTLNRSTDGGLTWGLNGCPTGITVANGDSVQPTPKFGTVNALLGGVIMSPLIREPETSMWFTATVIPPPAIPD